MKIYVATLMHVELRGYILRMVQPPSRSSSAPAFPAPAPPLASLGYLVSVYEPETDPGRGINNYQMYQLHPQDLPAGQGQVLAPQP